jgi:lysylphosphatidylglycerol synthetase-like protein (DUF2156 family)
MVDFNWKKTNGRVEVTDMLSLEIVGIMGALFAFLVYAMVRTQATKKEANAQQKAEERAARPVEETR